MSHTHHQSSRSIPLTCLSLRSLLISAGTTLVRLHVTKHRCNSSATLDTLPDLLCITQHTACMKGAAGCEHLVLLQQKAAASIVPVSVLTAVCGIALRAFLCLGLARRRPGSCRRVHDL